MKFEITKIGSGITLFAGEATSLAKVLEQAVRMGAYLTGADLTGANLTGADLTGAYLTRAYLTRAYLTGADLTGANLTGADLTGADLTGAYLTGADLTRAYLTRAYLTGANLTGANLTGADLTGAYLTGANLTGANLTGVLNGTTALASFCIVPAGTIIGWKKLRDGHLAKLEIPANAHRVNAYSSRKCRAEYAQVVRIEDRHGLEVFQAPSMREVAFVYRAGARVTPHEYDPNPSVECSSGIHFFITREEAEAYE